MSNPSASDLKSAGREYVLQSYNSAKAENHLRHLERDEKSTAEYIFQNQMEDANKIVEMFYNNEFRVISVQKKTKVGADGLMIELVKLLTTHPDDAFVLNPANVRIITGMSNAGWEKDMIDKAPTCFKNKIFHHGKLSKSNLINLKDSLIIIDEIDSGDREGQKLHMKLKDSGLLDIEYMKNNNIRFVFISATMFKEFHDLYPWGELHALYLMTIPDSYIGHKEFLEMGIVREYYDLKTKENAEIWVKEDIIAYYGPSDPRVHIVRVTTKTVDVIQNACIRNGIAFRNHTSKDRLSEDALNELFKQPLKCHIVIAVKGLFRRANLIPNCWKLRIGATHELYTNKRDNNVQIQGLTGRMSGYWRDIIESGHRTGPYRMSIAAIEEYEKTYVNPYGLIPYQTRDYTKTEDGKVRTKPTMLSAQNIANLVPIERPIIIQKGQMPIVIFTITDEEKTKYITATTIKERHIIINNYDAEILNKYRNYNLHYWNIDTPDKCEKYGLNYMMKPNALSSTTNVTDKTKNNLLIYLWTNKLIISPWNGEAI